MTGFIMSKDSQREPERKPDPLAQRPSAERIAEIKAKSDASAKRLEDAGMFGSGKGPPGLDEAFLRREKARRPATDK